MKLGEHHLRLGVQFFDLAAGFDFLEFALGGFFFALQFGAFSALDLVVADDVADVAGALTHQ